MTEYVCPVCGSLLEEVSYVSKGTQKTKLWCSDAIARLEADHKAVVYYPSGKRGYWSFGLKAKPIPVGSGEPHSELTPTLTKPATTTAKKHSPHQPRRHRRAYNRQRQLSL